MAELIPMAYRLRLATKQHVGRWLFGGSLALAVVAAGLILVLVWQQRQAFDYQRAAAEYHKRSSTIAEAQGVISRRDALAARMQTVQQWMDDKMLLSVLQGICQGFSASDSLEYVSIEARRPGKEGAEGPYVVLISGVTENNSTLADLITRLSRQSPAKMTVVLEASRRQALYDGQAVHFELRCQKAGVKGS